MSQQDLDDIVAKGQCKVVDGKPPVEVPPIADHATPDEMESDYAPKFEAWLRQRGYCPRTDKYIQNGMHRNRWYVHINETKRNPIVLDYLIWDASRFMSPLELELKGKGGSLRPNQRWLTGIWGGKLAYSFDEAKALVIEWEGTI